MTITNQHLENLKIKRDYDGNLYVLVNDEDCPNCYYTVYLAITESPESSENNELSAFRNHSSFGHCN